MATQADQEPPPRDDDSRVDLSNDIVFLGTARRVFRRGRFFDIEGLSYLIGYAVFPTTTAKSLPLLVSVSTRLLARARSLTLVVRDRGRPEHVATTGLEFQRVERKPADGEMQALAPVQTLHSPGEEVSVTVPLSIPREILTFNSPDLALFAPTVLDVALRGEEGGETPLGSILVGYAKPEAMSDAERLALRGRPDSIRTVLYRIGCPKCSDALEVYETLDGSTEQFAEQPGAMLLREAPDSWACECENVSFSLQWLKDGMHTFFRQPRAGLNDRVAARPLYERSSLEHVLAGFTEILNKACDEAALQRFLEQHPILLGFLSPVMFFTKPSLLGKYQADFGVLGSDGVLYLVEIEKPKTRLANKKGGVSAELQAGLDQIAEWRDLVSCHRQAVIEGLGLRSEQVGDVRYVLIAGRADSVEAKTLSRVRQSLRGDRGVWFHCFDDLGAYLRRLIGDLDRL